MNDKIVVLSDIHGNLSALEAVVADIETRGYNPDVLAILGDNINYGMRPNEVIGLLRRISERYRVVVNLFGNHEKAIVDGDTLRFSTERGKRVLDFTRANLTPESMDYIGRLTKEGQAEFEIAGKKVLFIHGCLGDPYWGKLDIATTKDESYSGYDYVISGHTHIPQLIEQFYPAENPEYRNKRRTVFLNPGSVGQPRNHNSRAQYLYLELMSEIFHFNSVGYDIATERSLFDNRVDSFYSDRLKRGI